MKLSQKIVEQRKKRGWSQEELAFRLDVSRQAVGKWESDLAMPEVDKIVQMSKLFDVSCDYLLNDDAASVSNASSAPVSGDANADPVQPVDNGNSLSRAQFDEIAAVVAKKSLVTAIAVALCVLSPVLLIVLAGLSEYNGLNENIASGVGICVMLGFVAVAVVMFVLSGKTSLENYNPDESSKAVLRDTINHRKGLFVTLTAIACGLCVLSVVPLLVATFMENEPLVTSMVGVLLGVVAVAVFMYVYVGKYTKCYLVLLGESAEGSKGKSVWSKIQSIYWLVIVAAYLAWSFLTFNWGFTWIIWPIAAVLSAVISIILDLCGIKRDEND